MPRFNASALAVVTVLLIVSIAYFVGRSRRQKERAGVASLLAGGLWVGDPGFLLKSGLSDLQFYIGPGREGPRPGYCIMTDSGGGFIANSAVTIDIGPPSDTNPTTLESVMPAVLQFDNAEDQPIPADLTLRLSGADGSLTLFDGEKIFAFMYKDHLASHAAKQQWGAPDTKQLDATDSVEL